MEWQQELQLAIATSGRCNWQQLDNFTESSQLQQDMYWLLSRSTVMLFVPDGGEGGARAGAEIQRCSCGRTAHMCDGAVVVECPRCIRCAVCQDGLGCVMFSPNTSRPQQVYVMCTRAAKLSRSSRSRHCAAGFESRVAVPVL
jgi:hypothetical protein